MTESMLKLSLVSKPSWTYQDIMSYLNVSKATAIKIKKRAIKECGGAVKFGDNYVLTDSVLALYGSNREIEIKVLKGIVEWKRIMSKKY